MKGVKELKRRLKGVKSIRKITKAMEMVSATKLRRLQERALATRPFANAIAGMLARVVARADASTSPLLQKPESVQREAIVLVGADKGLCGSYNSNLHRATVQHLRALEKAGVAAEMWILGKRPQGYFNKLKGLEISYVHPEIVERISYREVALLARQVTDAFASGRVQKVTIFSTRMHSMTLHKPTAQQLLPVAQPEASAGGADYILEPTADRILERLLPRSIEMQLYAAILDALASEFAARRMAMKNATDNADEMTHHLSMACNKARQSGITGELLEIIGGAEALNG